MLTKLNISIFTVSPMDGHKWQIARSEPAGESRNKLCSSILNNQEHPQPSLYNVQIQSLVCSEQPSCTKHGSSALGGEHEFKLLSLWKRK